MQTIEFYQSHLDRVSRSFAFCIQKLELPFRQWVSLSYLLCRALDTVEDSSWSSAELQTEQYQRFQDFMEKLPEPREVARWVDKFPRSIPAGEAGLLADSYRLFQDLHAMEEGPRNAIQSGVEVMRRGMQHYTGKSSSGVLRLTDLGDVNRYCYFVAGVVGQLATELFGIYRTEFRPSSEFHRNALHFGLFLQKINLLKDQGKDQREGRYFVPDRRELLSSLRNHAEGALKYLMELPVDERGYRTFCAWSLFLGAASIPWMEKAHAADDLSKIPRSVTQELLAAVESIVQDNELLRKCFDEYVHTIPAPVRVLSSAQPREDLTWFCELTRKRMDRATVLDLGLI